MGNFAGLYSKTMNAHLTEIITANDPAVRNRSLAAACRDLSYSQLLEEREALETFRRASGNLYDRVRTLFFLYAIDRFHLGVLYVALLGFLATSVLMLWGVLHPRVLPAIERTLSRIGLRFLKPHLDELSVRLAAYRERGRLFVGLLALATVVQLLRI